jgi:hypothetical protein
VSITREQVVREASNYDVLEQHFYDFNFRVTYTILGGTYNDPPKTQYSNGDVKKAFSANPPKTQYSNGDVKTAFSAND